MLAVKGSQILFDDPATVLDHTMETVDGDHGRIETSRATVLHDLAWLAERHGFFGLAAAGKIEATREIDGKTAPADRYHDLSKQISAARFLDAARAFWQVENRLHWAIPPPT